MTEKLKLPNQVIDSDWKDDTGLDYETYGTNKQEMEYISKEEVSKESIEKIKSMNVKFKNRGAMVKSLFSENDRLAA